MEQRQTASQILVDNGKSGAGDPVGAAQSPGESPGKGGLAHAQAALVGNHRTGRQHTGQPGAQGLRLRLAVREVFQVFRRPFSVSNQFNIS